MSKLEFIGRKYVSDSPFPVIKLAPSEKHSVRTFAVRRALQQRNNNYYERRNQHHISVIRRQILTGKIGEMIAYKTLLQLGYPYVPFQPPDLQIYPPAQKSFVADLSSSRHTFFVKASSVSSRWFQSWMFQNSKDGNGVDVDFYESLGDEDSITIFTAVDESCFLGKIMCLTDNLLLGAKYGDFDIPMRPDKRREKDVVYCTGLIVRGLFPTPKNYDWISS